MPYVLKSPSLGTNYIALDKRPDGTSWLFPFNQGESWKGLELPTSAYVVSWVRKGTGDLFDVMSRNAVSARLAILLKSAAPDLIELQPITIRNKNGTFVEGDYFLLNVLSNIYAVDYNNSSGSLGKKFDSTPSFKRSGGTLTLYNDLIANQIIWQDGALGRDVFVSDDLAELIRDAGLDVLGSTTIAVNSAADCESGNDG